MIPEFSRVALTVDLPSEGLKAGDIGTVVMVHQNGRGYEVEFCDLAGGTIAVVTLEAMQVREPKRGEIANARAVA